MKRITIDFSDCKSLADFCGIIKKATGFLDFDGYSFEALKTYMQQHLNDVFINVAGFECIPYNLSEYAMKTKGALSFGKRCIPNFDCKITVLLDFSKCKRMDEIHEVIKTAFKFPDFYGKNLDALWDCMGDYCDNEHAVLKGLDKIPKTCDFVIEEILGVFEDVRNNNQNFTFEISEE